MWQVWSNLAADNASIEEMEVIAKMLAHLGGAADVGSGRRRHAHAYVIDRNQTEWPTSV